MVMSLGLIDEIGGAEAALKLALAGTMWLTTGGMPDKLWAEGVWDGPVVVKLV
jgi:hypothetical protein